MHISTTSFLHHTNPFELSQPPASSNLSSSLQSSCVSQSLLPFCCSEVQFRLLNRSNAISYQLENFQKTVTHALSIWSHVMGGLRFCDSFPVEADYVCMYCMYVCMYECMYVSMYVCMYVLYVCIIFAGLPDDVNKV